MSEPRLLVYWMIPLDLVLAELPGHNRKPWEDNMLYLDFRFDDQTFAEISGYKIPRSGNLLIQEVREMSGYVYILVIDIRVFGEIFVQRYIFGIVRCWFNDTIADLSSLIEVGSLIRIRSVADIFSSVTDILSSAAYICFDRLQALF